MSSFRGVIAALSEAFSGKPSHGEYPAREPSSYWGAAITGVLLSFLVLVVMYALLFPFFESKSTAFTLPIIPAASYFTVLLLAFFLTAPFHRFRVHWPVLNSSIGTLVLAQSLTLGLLTLPFHAGDAQEVVLVLLAFLFLAGIMWQAVLLHNVLALHLKCPPALSAVLAGLINLAAFGHSVYLWYKVFAADSLVWDSFFFT